MNKNSIYIANINIIEKYRKRKNIYPHSSGIQKPLDCTVRFTIRKSFIIVNKPIVTKTSLGSEAAVSLLLQQQLIYLSSDVRATAFDSTKINGSESRLQESFSELNKSVESVISVPIEPNKVTFLVKMLFAIIEPIICPSASLNVNL